MGNCSRQPKMIKWLFHLAIKKTNYIHMKAKMIVALFILISSVSTFGQYALLNLPESVITDPELKGHSQADGNGSLKNYLLRNLEYPENSLQWNQEGTEVAQFIVTPEGDVTDLTIINSLSPDIDKEVIRVLMSTSGMWRPALENGKPVAKAREVSIVFAPGELNPDKRFIREAKEYLVLGNKQFFEKKNNKNALYFYDRAVRFVPNDKGLLSIRGICKYQLGDKAGACRDWNRIRTLGGMEGDAYPDDLCKCKGYSEMIGAVQGNK
jgi:hypothetical protein